MPAEPAAEVQAAAPAVGMAVLPGMDGAGDTAAAGGLDVNSQAHLTPSVETDTPRARSERLIYRAELRLASAEPEGAAKQLIEWAQANGGYVVAQQGLSLTLRIPSRHFYSSIDYAAGASELLDRKIDVQDVTEQYFDLETRVNNARAMRERLVDLLHRAQQIKDALAIERELARVTEELEVLEGKLRRLQELVAYSTISATWLPLASDDVQASTRLPFPWLATLGLGPLLQLEDQ